MADTDSTDNTAYSVESRSDLRELYIHRSMTLRDVADRVEEDISYEGVRYWLNQYGIERDTQETKWRKRPDWLDDEALRDLHHDDLQTVQEIRDRAGVESASTVKKWMRAADIEIMAPKEVRMKRMPDCDRCGISAEEEREKRSNRLTRMDASKFGYEGSEVCHACWMTLYHRSNQNGGETDG